MWHEFLRIAGKRLVAVVVVVTCLLIKLANSLWSVGGICAILTACNYVDKGRAKEIH